MGNVYFVEAGEYRIRKIDTAGRISTFAGTGEWGDSGDGGPAVSAQLQNHCVGIAADNEGAVYVADGRRIRKIERSGIIDAFAETESWARNWPWTVRVVCTTACAVERRFLLAGANPAQQLSLRLVAARAVRGGNEVD